MFWSSKVAVSPEFNRVLGLPRREFNPDHDPSELTQLLRKPEGSMTLLPIQAACLEEATRYQGLVASLPVGSGKTLLSFLLPHSFDSVRPLLLVPAAIKSKQTLPAYEALSEHWWLPRTHMMSYEKLSRESGEEELWALSPDLIIADECHMLKNPGAAVTTAVRRYISAHEPKMASMSGTLTTRSLRDIAHISSWCLKDGSPLPRNEDIEAWAEAIDERRQSFGQPAPGILLQFAYEAGLEHEDNRILARRGLKDRLQSTPGFVVLDQSSIDVPLTVTAVDPPKSEAIDEAFGTLRRFWETPDGWPISDAPTLYRHAIELALGFYYVWDPRPPKFWLEARRDWARVCRRLLEGKYKDTVVSTEGRLKARMLSGEIEQHAALDAWMAVENAFTPNTRAEWVDKSVLQYCADWMRRTDSPIVWTAHREFGEQLSVFSGVDYFGRQGLNVRGQFIEGVAKGTPVICSMQANRKGRNLQHGWRNNLLTTPCQTGLRFEQLIGRTHRQGQAHPVHVDVAVFCHEQAKDLQQSMADARFNADAISGRSQKLLLADVSTKTEKRKGPRWVR